MGTKASILIVDDDPNFRKTLSGILRARGYAPIGVATGKAALDSIEEEVPAVALIDLKLEDITGLELMRKIKECCPGTECIVLTGYASQESAIEAVNLGAYSYVQKPYDMEQLLVTVRRAVEKREAEEALRESEERYRSIVENSHAGILIVDETYRFTYVNDELCRILGYSREEIVGQDFRKFLDDESRELVADRYVRRQRGEDVPPRYEFNVVRKDGEKRRVEISSSVIRDSAGKVKTVAQILDITERKRAEERLRYQASLLENVSDAIISTDMDWVVQSWNEAAERTYGWEAHEIIGHPLGELVKPEYPYDSREVVIQKFIENGYYTGEVIHHRKDGTPINIWGSVSMLKDEDGNPAGAVSVNRDITERRQAEEEIRQRTAQLEALRQVALGLTAQLDLDTLLHSIASRAIELLGGAAGGLDLYQPDRDVLEWTASIGLDPAPSQAVLQRGEGLSGKVLETGEPLIVDDYHHWEGRAAGFEDCSFAPVVGVPVRWGDEFLGVLEVMAEPPRTFSPADAELLSLFATQAAIAIQNARLYEETHSRAERLAVVNHISRAVGATLHLDDLMETVYREVTSVFQADAFFIALYDEEANELDYRFRVDEGIREPPERRPLGTGLTGLVVSEKKPILVRDFEKEKDHLPEARLWGTMKAPASWLGVPMLIGEQLIGAICVQSYRPHTYGEEEELLLSTVADQVAVAIENARLFEQAQQEIAERKRAEGELQQSLEQLRKTFEGTVEVLVSTIGIRDPYTAVHQRQVTQLACAIADEMGLPEEQIQGIRMAGLIHDLGKINIPAEILSKPGTLSDLEYGLIRMHVRAGYDVLKKFDFPWPVAQIVLQHHERLDGSGYPQGLSDDEIMLEARILAVADVVAAMASHRPYRSALGVDKALVEISQNKGVLYDAEVADVCLKLFAVKGFEFE